MVTWFAGLFYLPRLFVYHADARDALGMRKIRDHGTPSVRDHDHRRGGDPGFRRRHAAGRARISRHGLAAREAALVALLIVYHGYCYKFNRAISPRDRNIRTAKWYRVFNEVPSLLLIGIVMLAVVKP